MLEAAPATPFAPLEDEMENADNIVMSDEVFEVEKGKKFADDEDDEEEEEEEPEFLEEMFETWDGEEAIHKLKKEAEKLKRKASRHRKSRRHHREEHSDDDDE